MPHSIKHQNPNARIHAGSRRTTKGDHGKKPQADQTRAPAQADIMHLAKQLPREGKLGKTNRKSFDERFPTFFTLRA